MKNLIIFALIFISGIAAAQPAIWGAAKIKLETGDTSYITKMSLVKDYVLSYATGGGTVTSVTGTDGSGFDFTVTNPTTTPVITLATTVSGMIKGSGNALTAATSGTDYSAGTSGLGTGILKSTTGTGALTIAVAGDFPTLNQNTTGSAATLTTSRLIYGGSFNGSADVTGIIGSEFGGTENGFTKFTGPATSEKTFTLPNATATILTDNAAVTAAQGGTGQTTYTIGDLLQATGSGTLSKLAAVATGNVLISGGVASASSWGKVALTTHVSGTLPVANGGTNLTAVGSDVTLLGSNGSANIYYTPAITTNSAAIGFSRASSTLNLNIPDADASFRGTVSTGTQTFAGAKTFNAKVTGSGGSTFTSTASLAAIEVDGVEEHAYRAVTTTSTVDENDRVVYIGTLSADITINLPACNATRDGWRYQFMKRGSDAFAFILDPNSTETFFDGATTKSFYGQGNTIDCMCNSGSTSWDLMR